MAFFRAIKSPATGLLSLGDLRGSPGNYHKIQMLSCQTISYPNLLNKYNVLAPYKAFNTLISNCKRE